MSVTHKPVEPEDYKLRRCEEILSLVFKPGVLNEFPLSDFQRYHDLTNLGLSRNNLVEIGKELFIAFPNLTWLDLRNNKLTSFPKFVNHVSLETILLRGNNIKRLPIELGSFPQLNCLQVSENPLEFPAEADYGDSDCDIIAFFRLCWKQNTQKPKISLDKEKKPRKTKANKADCLQPVKHFRNVSNVLVEKINSRDPIDQVLAEHVAKKLRNIEKQLQKSKDREALKSWRERYMGRGVARREKEENVPFGTDEEFLSMINRRELNSIRNNPKMKRKIIRTKKQPINFDEELKKIQQSLGNIKNRKSNNDLTPDKSRPLNDLKEINEIQKRIRALQMAN